MIDKTYQALDLAKNLLEKLGHKAEIVKSGFPGKYPFYVEALAETKNICKIYAETRSDGEIKFWVVLAIRLTVLNSLSSQEPLGVEGPIRRLIKASALKIEFNKSSVSLKFGFKSGLENEDLLASYFAETLGIERILSRALDESARTFMKVIQNHIPDDLDD